MKDWHNLTVAFHESTRVKHFNESTQVKQDEIDKPEEKSPDRLKEN